MRTLQLVDIIEIIKIMTHFSAHYIWLKMMVNWKEKNYDEKMTLMWLYEWVLYVQVVVPISTTSK